MPDDILTMFDSQSPFIQEHQYCGDLDGGVERDLAGTTCTCGATINRDADRD